jgi:hypothetical protein
LGLLVGAIRAIACSAGVAGHLSVDAAAVAAYLQGNLAVVKVQCLEGRYLVSLGLGQVAVGYGASFRLAGQKVIILCFLTLLFLGCCTSYLKPPWGYRELTADEVLAVSGGYDGDGGSADSGDYGGSASQGDNGVSCTRAGVEAYASAERACAANIERGMTRGAAGLGLFGTFVGGFFANIPGAAIGGYFGSSLGALGGGAYAAGQCRGGDR